MKPELLCTPIKPYMYMYIYIFFFSFPLFYEGIDMIKRDSGKREPRSLGGPGGKPKESELRHWQWEREDVDCWTELWSLYLDNLLVVRGEELARVRES